MTKLLKIERDANDLSVRDREILAQRLIQSAGHAPLSDIEEAWKDTEKRFCSSCPSW